MKKMRQCLWVPYDVVLKVVQGAVVHTMNKDLLQMDCKEVSMFPAIVHTCRTSFALRRSVMVSTKPLTRMACFDRERDFCKHPSFYCVLSPCDKLSIALDVLVPWQLRSSLVLSLNTLVGSRRGLAVDK